MTELPQFQKALSQALRYISYQQRSVFEVRTKLLAKYPLDTTEAVLQRLRELLLLDDERFAAQWVESRIKGKPRSIKLLSVELSRKGISSEVIASSVSNVDDEHNAYVAGKKFLDKRMLNGVNKVKLKLLGHLTRRGYSYTVIRKAVEMLGNEMDMD
ncbi:MAG: regulatory protein RecX [SAR202 cluster bacterium]|nr:regulatory protein RecX [SAR202 cluster bacterium]|tara:strand:- start:4070 stop:4540 length:471 start_codon:yes stop_codon:yes gene_type:complete